MTIIADISVVLAWFFEEEQTTQALAVLKEIEDVGMLVPPLWWYELENGILMGERRGRKRQSESDSFLKLVRTLPVRTDEMPMHLVSNSVLDIGRRYQLTSYDAAYLELAVRECARLATFDKVLINAAQGMGLPIFARM